MSQGTAPSVSGAGRYRRAWLITGAIGVVFIIVAALVFGISRSSEAIARHGRILEASTGTLRITTVARAQLGLALNLASIEEEFGSAAGTNLDIVLGSDVQEAKEQSLQEASQALAEIERGINAVLDMVGDAGGLSVIATDFLVDGQLTVQAIQLGDIAAARELDQLEVTESFQDIVAALDGIRSEEAAAITDAQSLASRMSDVAGFLVAFLVPLAVIVVFREIVKRQQRQAELELRIHAERAVSNSRDEFVANASHELRTPLTSIYGLAQVLEESEELSETGQELTGLIIGEASDLSRMVEDLLTTARLDAGALRFELENVVTRDEVDDVVRPFDRSGSPIDVDVKPAVVRVDRLRQRQVLRNLISNARKYGGPQIRLEGSRQGQWYVWIIADNGDGVPAELEERLFSRFLHQGYTAAVPGGVGLGLSIVKALAEGMGGTVDYERADGETRFIVRVPLAAPAAAGAATGAPGFIGEERRIAAAEPYRS
jgi:signal transduction histidine kinase